MSGLFYNLGRSVGPHLRKAKWIFQSVAGTQVDAIKAENSAGLDLAHQVRRQLEIDSDRRTADTLSNIGLRLSARVADKLRRFSFESVKGSEPNAFALPGGFIFVTRSILELCQWDENQVAFILGHEMGHVIKGHAMERILSNSVITAASRAARPGGVLTAWFGSFGIQLLRSAYSQDQELEADTLGIRLAAAGGYNPRGAVELLSRLGEWHQHTEGPAIGDYFSSHPSAEVRIANVRRLLRQMPK